MLSPEALQVVDVARAAGAEIRARYRRPTLGVTDKTDGSPVTEADLAADRLIRAELAARFALPIVSEESEPPPPSLRATWPAWWLVDPLDGTRDFVAGTDQFCVCIARVTGAYPDLGVLFAPVTGVAYAAERGRGAWRIDAAGATPSRLTCPAGPEGPIRAFKSRFHSSPRSEAWLRAVGATTLVEMGSALKFAALAEGSADVFVSMSSAKLWDLAAGQIVAEEAGATVLSLESRARPRHDGPTLLAGPYAVLSPRLDAGVLDRVEYRRT